MKQRLTLRMSLTTGKVSESENISYEALKQDK